MKKLPGFAFDLQSPRGRSSLWAGDKILAEWVSALRIAWAGRTVGRSRMLQFIKQ
jgi:hypothetical protein